MAEHAVTGPSRQQLESAYREAIESPDIRVPRLALQILWRKLDEALAELNKEK